MKRKFKDSFLNLLSDVSEEKQISLKRFVPKKKNLSFFDDEIKDSFLSVYVFFAWKFYCYSRLYRSNELIVKSKSLFEDIIKNLNNNKTTNYEK
jgi:hypothetical protein